MTTEFLVGYTGFVGSNLEKQHMYTAQFNSQNIQEAYGKKPELLVYAGVRAEMFLANQNAEADLQHIMEAVKNIEKISPQKLVLISTVAVYPTPVSVDESTEIENNKLTVYGSNRLFLERWVEQNLKDYLIVRLPAIYGDNLKKNFLYDYIHIIPPMLALEKYEELEKQDIRLRDYYIRQENGYYKCKMLSGEEQKALRSIFRTINFSALSFTDSRSVYQFYDLKYLWEHIQIAMKHKITKLNLVTPPISTAEIYRELCGREFNNLLQKSPFCYDVRTQYDYLFGGYKGYVMTKEQELQDIVLFVRKWEQFLNGVVG